MGPVLFNIFISDIDAGIECNISKTADDIKLSGETDAVERRDAIQRDTLSLERQSCANLMKFNQDTCSIVHLGQGNP